MNFLLPFIVFFCFLTGTLTAKAEELTLTLGVVQNSKDVVVPEIIPKITKAFESIGVRVTIRPIASTRIAQLVNQGVLDGDIMRRKDFYNSARLWPVSTAVASFDFWVWTQRENVKRITATSDLKNFDLITITNFAYFDQIPWYRKKLVQPDVHSAVKFVGTHGGYTLLPKRILEMNIPEIFLSKIDTALEKPLVELEFYTWLNHRHAHLRDKINAAYAREFAVSEITTKKETKLESQPTAHQPDKSASSN